MRKRGILIFALTAVTISVFFSQYISTFSNVDYFGRKMQRHFNSKLNESLIYIDQLKTGSYTSPALLSKLSNLHGMSVLVFKEKQLEYWSDNAIPYQELQIDSIKNGDIIKLLNHTYYLIKQEQNNKVYCAFIDLMSHYPYKNQFIPVGIHPDYGLPLSATIEMREVPDSYPIVDNTGEVAFYVQINKLTEEQIKISNRIAATLFLLLGFILLLLYFRNYLKTFSGRALFVRIIIIVGGLVLFRFLLTALNIISDRYYLFDPYSYATWFAPSIGDLILNTGLYIFICYLISRYLSLPKRLLTTNFNRNSWIGILNLVFLLVLIYAQRISVGIINNSSIKLIVYDISQVSFYTVLAYSIIAIHFVGVVLLANWVFVNLVHAKTYRIYINAFVLFTIYYVISFLFNLGFDIFTLLFAVVIYFLTGGFGRKLRTSHIFSYLVVFLLLFSVYILAFTSYYHNLKESNQTKSFASSLSNEHDAIAEYLIEGLSADLQTDMLIPSYIQSDNLDLDGLREYLSKYYFQGYWKKYLLYISLCTSTDSLYLNSPEDTVHCYNYFNHIIESVGVAIPSSSFYYLDNYSGRIKYLGKFTYTLQDQQEITMFLELNSELTTEPLGYPELLLDERSNKQILSTNYTYAKYHRNGLISSSGSYDYSHSGNVFKSNTSELFHTIKHNKYKHLVYHPDSDNIIVVSRPSMRFVDRLVLFSYVFVYYYLVGILIVILFFTKYRQINLQESLRTRIQFAIVSILFISLILIAGSSVWFNVRKYNQTQFRLLKEKIQSVYVELEHKLSDQTVLTPDWSDNKYDNLNLLLIKFSQVFYSDINLYNPQGDLLATSRGEVFQQGLQNDKMEPLAFYKMDTEKLAQFVHKEKISKLEYLSAYLPFFNSEGKVLAYLNLPYFTKQKELQADITTLTVAIINIYVLLILLTIIFAVFISNQITRPLEIIQLRFRELALEGKYEKIEYSRMDEIGDLVNEYNNMVVELKRNLDLLAQSERESAWREMAKQIAHEIKNPLTPMMLNVQHLQRAWKDKKENFGDYLNRVAALLVEQIDNLSTIASEFSNFAKMPVANIEALNINEVLNKSVTLFKSNERVTINYLPSSEELIVKADKEQLNRVFINIIKNAIQAIPDERDGIINIGLEAKDNNAIISIQDNGKGISTEIEKQLFMPNFTTKSSGMGLGLAIVKKILEQIDSQISFKTELGKGSVFYITVPLS